MSKVLHISLLLITLFKFLNASVMLWASRPLNVPSLKFFNYSDLQKLLIQLEDPKILSVNLYDLEELRNATYVKGIDLYKAYIPNVDLDDNEGRKIISHIF